MQMQTQIQTASRRRAVAAMMIMTTMAVTIVIAVSAALTPAALGAATATAATAALQDQDDASAAVRAIIDRAIETMGGVDAIQRIENAQYDFVIEVPDRPPLPAKALVREPNHLIFTMPLQNSITEQGYNGEVTWQINRGGNTYFCVLQPESTLAELHPQTMLHRLVIDLRSLPELPTMLGPRQLHERTCHALEVRHDENSRTVYYFDLETGRLAGIERFTGQGDGAWSTVYLYDDWKAFGDVSLPTAIRTAGAGQQPIGVQRLTDAAFNVLNERHFRPPPVVYEIERANRQLRGERDLLHDLDFTPEMINRMSQAEAQEALVKCAQTLRNAQGDEALREELKQVLRQLAARVRMLQHEGEQ